MLWNEWNSTITCLYLYEKISAIFAKINIKNTTIKIRVFSAWMLGWLPCASQKIKSYSRENQHALLVHISPLLVAIISVWFSRQYKRHDIVNIDDWNEYIQCLECAFENQLYFDFFFTFWHRNHKLMISHQPNYKTKQKYWKICTTFWLKEIVLLLQFIITHDLWSFCLPMRKYASIWSEMTIKELLLL